ncbi:hypothetical protein [Streptomyces deserti]
MQPEIHLALHHARAAELQARAAAHRRTGGVRRLPRLRTRLG